MRAQTYGDAASILQIARTEYMSMSLAVTELMVAQAASTPFRGDPGFVGGREWMVGVAGVGVGGSTPPAPARGYGGAL